MRPWVCTWLAGILCLWASLGFSAPLTLTDSHSRLSPYSQLRYFCSNPESAPRIDELRSKLDSWPWQAHGPEVPNLGYTTRICWYRLSVLNRSDASAWTLGLDFPLLTLVDAYLINSQQQVLTHYREGGDLPYRQRQTHALAYAFQFNLPPTVQHDILLRVDSANLQLPLTLMETGRFAERQVIITVIHSLFIGGMLMMIIYSLLLYISLCESAWLPYVFWATLITGLQVILLGFGPRFLWPDNPGISTFALEGVLSGMLIVAPWFVNRFLNLPFWTPRLAHILRLHIIVGVMLLLAIPFTDRISLMTVQLISLLSLTLFVVAAVLLSYRRAPEEKSEVRGFIIAWASFVVGSIVMILNKLGMAPRTLLTEYLLEAGTFFAVALLSRAVAAQINRLKAEKAHAESMSKAKSEFLATMSHEIRTPMNGVLGLTDLLRHTPLNNQQSQYVDTIYQSSQVLLTVINDILDYSKIVAGKLSLEQIETSLEQLMGDCIALHSPRIINKPVKLWSEIVGEVPDSIMTDPLRLKQILNNLLSNACKFTEAGDVTLQVRVHNNQLYFEVRDSGIGLTREEQERIFESYEQAGSTSHRYGGTGLGLSISKHLVTLMGGNIGVRSQPGKGACFWISLPLKSAAHQNDNTLSGRSLTILTSDVQLGQNLQIWAERYGMLTTTIRESSEISEAGTPDILVLGPDHANKNVDILLPASTRRLLIWPLSAMPLPGNTPVIELPLHPAKFRATLTSLLQDKQAHETAKTIPNQPNMSVLMADLKVLVVEDNSVNQLVLSSLLKSIGVEATITCNGAEALERVIRATEEWDIIFMDTEMPVMDGHTATRKIRHWESKTDRYPSWIIAISAHATPDRIQEARTAGVSDYLGKPVTRLQIMEALREALRQRIQAATG